MGLQQLRTGRRVVFIDKGGGCKIIFGLDLGFPLGHQKNTTVTRHSFLNLMLELTSCKCAVAVWSGAAVRNWCRPNMGPVNRTFLRVVS